MAYEIEIVEILREYFSPMKDILFVFLFGSHARRKTFRESDVDIAIYFKKGCGPRSA